MRARAMLLAMLSVAAVALAGCGKEAAPTAPVARLGPAVEEVYPPARATRVPLGTALWVRFAAPLDPTTITTTNVFLMLDAARVPVALTYDVPTRTLGIRPLAALRLRRTYTVELSPRIATADGVALDSTYFWQFTTTSVRPLEHPAPASGAVGQSPFVALGWDATESSAGPVRFSVYTGADSASVAARIGTPAVLATPYQLAPARRAYDSAVWWAVDAVHLETGERVSSPVWRFTVVGAGAAIDSLVPPYLSFASVSASSPERPNCSNITMSIGGPNVNAAIGWDLAALPPGLRIAGARLLLWPTSIFARTEGTALWATTGPFDGCSARYSGPPYRDLAAGALATGVLDAATGVVSITGDRLAAHLQFAASYGGLTGYAFTSDASYSITSPNANELRPALRVYYYRDPPVAPATTAAPASHARSPRE